MNKKELFTKIAEVAILNESRFTRQDLKDIVRIFQNNRTVADPEDPLFAQEELEKIIKCASGNAPVVSLSGACDIGTTGLGGMKIHQDYYCPPSHRPSPLVFNKNLTFTEAAKFSSAKDKFIGSTNVSYLQPDCVQVSEFKTPSFKSNQPLWCADRFPRSFIETVDPNYGI